MSLKCSTRSACAIYSRVALKASTSSTGRLVIKPMVSRSAILVPEGNVTLYYFEHTGVKLC